MSLDYNGYTFYVSIPGQKETLCETAGPTNDPEGDKKKAFLAAMAKFADSEDFKNLTSELFDEFSIDVQSFVSTSMPR